jgi:NAD(P)-dependent dehydrogenase (short-subunit alcohol dehydrogenase family)
VLILNSGASRGIGRAVALHLASRGASVLGTCSSPESLSRIQELAAAISDIYRTSAEKAPRLVGLDANLLDPDTPQRMAAAVEKEFDGKVHILVNNAAYDELRSIGQLDADYVQRCLFGNIQTLALSVDLLFRKAMFQPNSRIVNISSDQTKGSLAHQ